ncbi:Hypothetical predicted protein [Mytilus galloprovincialis]|uniref:Endonuclease/exonuclease/phosphatase domain-containing protein n=1 Tax=Mytilus galloprovincialis TaxID=29158 RepID=A0A8B6FHJ3_MYTGA|nr:Hypothetical predicted protein [Mytilus galloprovincialis]
MDGEDTPGIIGVVEGEGAEEVPANHVPDRSNYLMRNWSFFQNFEVIRARTLIEENAAVGSYDPKHIPDHSLLCWTFVTPGYDVQQTVSQQLTDNGNVRSVKYDTRSIPNDWMSDSETISKLNTFITELEESEINQLNLDNKYEDFVKIVQTEMDLKLNKRKTNIYDGKSNKRRRMKKSWWNENLTLLWNDVCKAERAWHKCHKRMQEGFAPYICGKTEIV